MKAREKPLGKCLLGSVPVLQPQLLLLLLLLLLLQVHGYRKLIQLLATRFMSMKVRVLPLGKNQLISQVLLLLQVHGYQKLTQLRGTRFMSMKVPV
jgi:hypothetical protein